MARFLTDGIRATSVDAVVEEAAVSKATLYRHFATKEALVEAVVAERDAQWRSRFDGVVEGRAGRAGIRAVFASLRPWFASGDYRGCSLLNAATEVSELSDAAAARVTENRRWMRALLRRLAGEAGCAKPDEVAAGLLVVLDGAIVRAVVDGSPEPAEDAARVADVLVAASCGA